MAEGILRGSESGPIIARKGAIAVPATNVPGSGSASATSAFVGAKIGDVVNVSPRAALAGACGIWQAMVLSADVLTIVFGTGGAALTVAAQTMDATIQSF